MMKVVSFTFLWMLSTMTLLASTSADSIKPTCPIHKIKVERLPDLNIPRAGHTVMCLNGEVTAIGGHTTNFVPTPTAEYFKDGEWHLIQMPFDHDNGLAVPLSSGKVLVAGGHEKNMGIGQTYGAELYDPTTHTFEGIASLDTKRCLASATELDSGKVIISGNWCGNDTIEIYDGQYKFSNVKNVTFGRTTPYILRISKDDAIIVGHLASNMKNNNTPIVDCLRGEPRHIPLLEKWSIHTSDVSHITSNYFIGNEKENNYSYLLLADDNQGHYAIVLVKNGNFSLLPTTCEIPTETQWGKIFYRDRIIVDRKHKRAYLTAWGAGNTRANPKPVPIYIITIDYAETPACLTLGYTEPLADCCFQYPTLTQDGNLMLVGGIPSCSQFKPTNSTWLLHVNNDETPTLAPKNNSQFWLLIIGLLLSLGLFHAILHKKRLKKDNAQELGLSIDQLSGPQETCKVTPKENDDYQPVTSATNSERTIENELMQRISLLMEEEKLFLNPNLKESDISERFGVHRNYVSECINKLQGCTFPQFLANYRIAYAQQLMRSHPKMTIAAISMESGFASERSFYRTFRQVVGMNPKEWIDKKD